MPESNISDRTVSRSPSTPQIRGGGKKSSNDSPICHTTTSNTEIAILIHVNSYQAVILLRSVNSSAIPYNKNSEEDRKEDVPSYRAAVAAKILSLQN